MRRFFRKRLPAFLLTLVMVMTMVPAVSAKSLADLTYEVIRGTLYHSKSGSSATFTEVNIVVIPAMWYSPITAIWMTMGT